MSLTIVLLLLTTKLKEEVRIYYNYRGLNKGFIQELMSFTIALLLFTTKLKEEVKIYYNYRGLNNITIKN